MKDTIYREAAIEALEKIFAADPMKSEYTEGITCGAALAIEYIKQLPPAQHEIIQCKDCQYWEYGKRYGRCKLTYVAVTGRFYCAAAKERII